LEGTIDNEALHRLRHFLIMKHIATTWNCAQCVVSLESPVIVGILNVTPDSFSDGGKYESAETAILHGLDLAKAGAAIIDVGGESTRPGAVRVPAEVQIERVLPVIRGIRECSSVLLSIDTTSSVVANMAMEAGASIINDISSGVEDEEIFEVAAKTGAGFVLMHRRLPPELDTYSHEYKELVDLTDIVQDVSSWLESRISIAIAHGVHKSAIAIDPGLGFGKSVEQNWQLIREASRITALGYPVFVGASRKSFIGAKTGITEPELRDEASAEISVMLAQQGVQIFRVHNVSAHLRMLQSLSQS
jgi:dihydropteroate synthase